VREAKDLPLLRLARNDPGPTRPHRIGFNLRQRLLELGESVDEQLRDPAHLGDVLALSHGAASRAPAAAEVT